MISYYGIRERRMRIYPLQQQTSLDHRQKVSNHHLMLRPLGPTMTVWKRHCPTNYFRRRNLHTSPKAIRVGGTHVPILLIRPHYHHQFDHSELPLSTHHLIDLICKDYQILLVEVGQDLFPVFRASMDVTKLRKPPEIQAEEDITL